jgi:adenosylmethionine-8-amino-7-oxononanoate aminotransferase
VNNSQVIVDVLADSNRVFVHGHTYQGHPVGCAAALEVQRIIQEDNLLENVRELGLLLSNLLKERLSNHPNVGDIRGRGFFWGIELVADKQTKAPFPSSAHVSMEICERGLSEEYSTCVYPAGGGGKEGSQGDAIIISPPYTVTKEEIRMLVSTVVRLINDFFKA